MRLPRYPLDLQLQLARENVAWAADRAAAVGCEVMIEALNPMDNGPCLLTTTAAAARFARQTGRDNVRLQYDVYHMQRVEGEITGTLDAYWDLISHIQIADVPGRGEPGTGEINYPFVLGHLERSGYGGYVGVGKTGPRRAPRRTPSAGCGTWDRPSQDGRADLPGPAGLTRGTVSPRLLSQPGSRLVPARAPGQQGRRATGGAASASRKRPERRRASRDRW